MTGFKTTLLAATALTILTGAALAGDNNRSFVYQGNGAGISGITVENNSALVQQTGTDNQAGNEAQNLLQNGSLSNILINQSGSTNQVGLAGVGVEQYGLRNDLTVTQNSDTNVVGEVVQDGQVIGAKDSKYIRNELTITQSDKGGHSVDYARQIKSLAGSKNTASVMQTGSSNQVFAVSQEGAGNKTTINQSGKDGFVDDRQTGTGNENAVTQTGTNNEYQNVTVGDDNKTTVNQAGSNNRAYVDAGASGAASNMNVITIDQGLASTADDARVALFGTAANIVDIDQNGANIADVQVTGGSLNEFKIKQNLEGSSEVSTATVTATDSSSNLLDAMQEGTNALTLTLTNAFGNEVTSTQLGSNTATVSIANSELNTLEVTQIELGARNFATVDVKAGADKNSLGVYQLGSNNRSNITVDGGDRNTLNAYQHDTNNQIDVLLKGSDNNSVKNSPAFSDKALTASNTFLGLLKKGSLAQSGTDNRVNLTVTGDGNAFATGQLGTSNRITGTISGNGNQAFVAQFNTGNQATFTQAGNGNNLGIVQGVAPALLAKY